VRGERIGRAKDLLENFAFFVQESRVQEGSQPELLLDYEAGKPTVQTSGRSRVDNAVEREAEDGLV